MFSANSSQVSDDKLFVEDVFSTYLYPGNGSTQTITNGIDLAGKGGLVWTKNRNSSNFHSLIDTVRGADKTIWSNSSSAGSTYTDAITAFGSTGYTMGADATGGQVNSNYLTYASWTFREAPKFFDVVTYTGNDTSRSIAHNLGVAPGCIIVKNISQSGFNWVVYHRSTGATQWLKLNLTDAVATNATYFPTDPTATTFAIGSGGLVNNSGDTYVAYLFAHDATSDGIIQCGSYTAGGSPVVTLGWEPQWLMIKNATTGDVYQDWYMFDNMRKLDVSNSGNAPLRANTSGAEGGTYATSSYNLVQPRATGFVIDPSAQGASGVNNGSDTYIYMAIRRGPMRTPTLGTSVFKPVTYTGDGTTPRNLTGAGFPPDYAIQSDRGSGNGRAVYDKLRGTGKKLITNTTAAESSVAGGYAGTMLQDGIVLDNNNDNYNLNGNSYVTHLFRRAPGFFDEVCYTGTGVLGRTVAHNLGVAPEMIIVKRRSAANDWGVYHSALGNTKLTYLNYTFVPNAAINWWNNTTPTASVFTVGDQNENNSSGSTYVSYLFASCPGVSKVGSYTGNGSSQTIDCGFASGARFVLIRRTDSTGDWYVWDTARGIVAGNDPHLSLNTTAAEVTSNDTIDTDSSGFVVNQDAATNVNVNAATYIYLAIA